MRNTTIWAASMALMYAPFLTAAVPQQQFHNHRRNHAMQRRQNSAGISIDNALASSSQAVVAASQAPEVISSTPANAPASIVPLSVALSSIVPLPSVPLSIPSEPSISPAAEPVSSLAPQPQELPSSAAPVAVQPSVEASPAPASQAPPAPSAAPSVSAVGGGFNIGAVLSSILPEIVPNNLLSSAAVLSSNPVASVAVVSEVVPVAASSVNAIVPSLAVPSLVISSLAVPSLVVPSLGPVNAIVSSLVDDVGAVLSSLAPVLDVPSSAVGGASVVVASIALPSASIPINLASPTGENVPDVAISSTVAEASIGVVGGILNSLLNPSAVASVTGSGTEPSATGELLVPIVNPVVSLLNPSGGLVSQIIVGLNTIISDGLPQPSADSAVPNQVASADASQGIVSAVVDALPTGSIDLTGAVQSLLPAVVSILPSGVVNASPSGVIEGLPSLLPSGDIVGGIVSALPSNILPSIALPTGSVVANPVPSDLIISALPSIALPTGAINLSPFPSVLPSGGSVLPSGGFPLSAGVSELSPQPSGLVSQSLPLPSPGISAPPPTPSGFDSAVASPIAGASPVIGASSIVAISPSQSVIPPGAGVVTASSPPVPTNSDQVFVSAIGSDAKTALAAPSDIVVAPVDVAKPTSTPSNLPKVIQPPGGRVTKQANTTLIQIGFLEPLNYDFVSANADAINQIFQFMPVAVSDGLKSPDVKMQSIQPYDTLKTYKYMTTLAMLYVPIDSISQLTAGLRDPNSALYQNPDSRVATLMSFVNPAIPLTVGQAINPAVAASANPSYSPGSSSGADPFGEDAKSGNPVNTSSAAIATPLAVGAMVYGCAMMFVARRYKQRRQSRRRASSLNGEPAWMTEARAYNNASRESHGSGSGSSGGRSARTQQISAPLNSSNSLGW